MKIVVSISFETLSNSSAQSGKMDDIKYLISQGVNINEKIDRGENILHIADRRFYLDVIKYLISVEKTNEGENVLHMAVRSSSLNDDKYLISQGKNINKKTNRRENVIHFASGTSNLNVTEHLIINEVNDNEKTNEGENALHIAAGSTSNSNVIEYLIKKELTQMKECIKEKVFSILPLLYLI